MERLSHAYIIAAAPEPGYARALELGREMLCTGPEPRPCGACPNCRKAKKNIHPDLITVARQSDDKGKAKREIYVDQIRDLAADAVVLPGEAERKVYILRDAGTMNPAAQNALLKLLEEPPAFVSLVLVTDNTDLLLETVRSRCVLLRLAGEEEAPPAEARALAERYLDLAAARAAVSLVTFANEAGELSGDELLDFTRAVRLLAADMLCGRLPDRRLSRGALLRLAGLMDRAADYLRCNVSGKHVLGMLMAETVPLVTEPADPV